MPFPTKNPSKVPGVLDRVINSLSVMLEQDLDLDPVEFAEHPDYLNLKLYPRQRLILKVYYRVPLGKSECQCKGLAHGKCNLCDGSGVYDELADARRLLRADDKYRRFFYPGIRPDDVDDYSDEELRYALTQHRARKLILICGRRGSKSMIGAVIYAYTLYRLLRVPSPQKLYGLPPGQKIGLINVATEEKQAKIILEQLVGLLQNSPWFRKIQFQTLDTEIRFPGRNIEVVSYHSNSNSVRGGTNMLVEGDEICFFNKNGAGKQTDTSMMRALIPSTATFKRFGEARVYLASSPDTQEGKAYEYFHQAETGSSPDVIAFQLATWEMNPTVTREDLQVDYDSDPEGAEVEYGAQWAESVGRYIPQEAVDACATLKGGSLFANPGIRYHFHCDLSKKKDRTGMVAVHMNADTGQVEFDRIEEIDPRNSSEEFLTPTGEIDQEKVLKHIIDLMEIYRFRFNTISFDQFNSAWLIQRLRAYLNDPKGDVVFEVNANEKTNRECFSALRSLVVQGGVAYWEHPSFKKQLKGLVRKQKDSGAWKVEAAPGESDDLADPAAVACKLCLDYATGHTSGIHIVDEQDDGEPGSLPPGWANLFEPSSSGALSPQASPPQEPPHLPGCNSVWCEAACPNYAYQVSLALNH